MNKTEKLQFRTTEELASRLRNMANKKGMTLSNLVNQLLSTGIFQMEKVDEILTSENMTKMIEEITKNQKGI